MSSSVPAESAMAECATAVDALAVTTPPAAVDAAEAADASHEAQSTAPSTAVCANCGASLAGKYCSQCGQRHDGHPVHHFWHFVSEATEDLTHADSRLWQTLFALLFRPGFLTREFLEGRRARYLPPVRLYLVVSVIFFLIAGLHSRISSSNAVVAYDGRSFQYRVVPAGKSAGPGPLTPPPAQTRATTGSVTAPVTGPAALGDTPAERQRVCQQTRLYIEQHGGWLARLGPRVGQSCLASVSEGGLARLNEAVEKNLERAMFLLLPLLALAMKPLYLEPRRYYVEHLLFLLHDHAFLFVILGASTLLALLISSGFVVGSVHLAITLYIPIYFYRAMRRVYGQGTWLTLSKLAALGVAYFFLGVLMLVATVSYSFLML